MFSSIVHNSRKNNGKAYFVSFAPWLYNSYNHTRAPGPHMWPSPGPGPDFKCSETVEDWKSDVHVHVAHGKSVDIREEHFPRVVSTSLNHIHAIAIFTFTQSHSICAAFTVHLLCHCTHLVAPTPRSTHAAPLMPQHLEDMAQKKPMNPPDGIPTLAEPHGVR